MNVRARMDEETRRQFFAHNRSCRKRLDAQLEALRKGGHAAGKGRIECERCGKCLRTDMARKKHLAACTGEGKSLPNLLVLYSYPTTNGGVQNESSVGIYSMYKLHTRFFCSVGAH